MEAPRYYSRHSLTLATHGGNLPHWSQSCATFVTFRLADSLPTGKLETFRAAQAEWLAAHPLPWTAEVEREYEENFPERFQKWLDAGYGECLLRGADARRIVEEVVRKRDGVGYSLYSFVVMPNHVHVLFMPKMGADGRKEVQAWKSITARRINALFGRSGTVWQKESYDRLVRDVAEFSATRSYIRGNNSELAFDAYAP